MMMLLCMVMEMEVGRVIDVLHGRGSLGLFATLLVF